MLEPCPPPARQAPSGPVCRNRADRLHVGVVLPAPGDGGVGKTMFALSEEMARRGHRVDLLLLRQYGRRPEFPSGVRLFVVRGLRRPVDAAPALRNRRPAAALRPGPLSVARAWFALRLRHPELRASPVIARDALAVAAYTRAARPAALVSAGAAANLAALLGARDAKVPVAVSIRAAVAEGYDAAARARARSLYPRARAVIGVSRGVAGQAAALLGLEARRVHAIYNGVRAADIRRRSAEAPAHPWFSDGGPPVILSVGRFAPQKDHPTLVEAFARLRRRRAARLVVMGAEAGCDRRALCAASRRLGRRGGCGRGRFRRQSVPLHAARRRVRAVVALGGPAGRAAGGAGVRNAGCQHRRARSDRRRYSAAGAGARSFRSATPTLWRRRWGARSPATALPRRSCGPARRNSGWTAWRDAYERLLAQLAAEAAA